MPLFDNEAFYSEASIIWFIDPYVFCFSQFHLQGLDIFSYVGLFL